MIPGAERSIIDLSHTLDATTPPFPASPPVEFTDLDAVGRPGMRGQCNASAIHTSLHTGTHMDAPYHFCPDRATIDRVPLDACLGPAVRVRLEGVEEIDIEHLLPCAGRLRALGRAILDTGWYRRWRAPEYFSDHPVISVAAARFLVDSGVRLVGVDFPSVDRDPNETHRVLLGHDVLIVENLTNLDALPVEEFYLVATPLGIGGRDGSPVRALALVEPGGKHG